MQQEIEQKNVHKELTDSPLPWVGLKCSHFSSLEGDGLLFGGCTLVRAVVEPYIEAGDTLPAPMLQGAKRQGKCNYLGLVFFFLQPLLKKNFKGEILVLSWHITVVFGAVQTHVDRDRRATVCPKLAFFFFVPFFLISKMGTSHWLRAGSPVVASYIFT